MFLCGYVLRKKRKWNGSKLRKYIQNKKNIYVCHPNVIINLGILIILTDYFAINIIVKKRTLLCYVTKSTWQ